MIVPTIARQIMKITRFFIASDCRFSDMISSPGIRYLEQGIREFSSAEKTGRGVGGARCRRMRCPVVDRYLKRRVSPHLTIHSLIRQEIGQKNVAKIYLWFSDVKMVVGT